MELLQACEQLTELQAKLSAFGHAMALIYYDGATTAPKGTAANRGQTLSILSRESYLLSTGETTVQLLEFLDAHKDELDAKQARIVEVAIKDIREMKKIPMEEYVAYQQLLVEAEDAWHTAKQTNDFALFCPYLEQIFATERRFALYCAPDMHPYNYCLNKYEEGLTMERCDEFFAALRSRLVPLFAKIKAAPQLDDACIHGEFCEAEQEKFALELMKAMGIDMDHCGLGTTEHPFTTSLGSHHDVRITTNYDKENLANSMFSVIHEGGHALYDLNSDDSLAYTLLDGGVSMGIHESQSRFYENLLGRSRAFIDFMFPRMQECFPTQLANYTAEDMYRAVNLVTPRSSARKRTRLRMRFTLWCATSWKSSLCRASLRSRICPQLGTVCILNIWALRFPTTRAACCRTVIGRAAASVTSPPMRWAAHTARSCLPR